MVIFSIPTACCSGAQMGKHRVLYAAQCWFEQLNILFGTTPCSSCENRIFDRIEDYRAHQLCLCARPRKYPFKILVYFEFVFVFLMLGISHSAAVGVHSCHPVATSLRTGEMAVFVFAMSLFLGVKLKFGEHVQKLNGHFV
jgi:hypothetical protein